MSESTVKFEFDSSDNKVYAVCQSVADSPIPVTEQYLLEKLASEGYDKYHLFSNGIENVVKTLSSKESKNTKICVAEKRDAEATVTLSKDKMEAYLSIAKAEGGNKVSVDTIKSKLAEKGIRHGLITKNIKKAIVKGYAENELIAKGEPVQNGEDARFTCLIKNIKVRTPQVQEDGHVDYRDLGEITVVHPNEKLMRRDAATLGTPSKNVCGEMITPKPGKDTLFASNLEGSAASPGNPNVLVATTTGQPIICDNGVMVEKTMTIENVDLKSGNIVFDGSVVVEGDVSAGMKVKASGDIKIKGMVENAHIDAGGDINIKGAVIGRAETNSSDTENLVTIDAKGSVSAKFVENALIHSGHKIMIQDWIVNSDVTAINEVVVGKKDAKKGQIMGGSVTSGILVKAMNIGSHAGATTNIQVGNASDLDEEIHKVGIQISQQTKALFELQKVFKDLKNNPTRQAKEMLKKALASKKQFEAELISLRTQAEVMEQEKRRIKNAKVVVEKQVYSGVSINISHHNKNLQEDISGRTFSLKDGKIVQSN